MCGVIGYILTICGFTDICESVGAFRCWEERVYHYQLTVTTQVHLTMSQHRYTTHLSNPGTPHTVTRQVHHSLSQHMYTTHRYITGTLSITTQVVYTLSQHKYSPNLSFGYWQNVTQESAVASTTTITFTNRHTPQEGKITITTLPPPLQ